MKIGKRFLTDSLIVLLGVVILFISGLITYTTWFVPAEETIIPQLGISYPNPTFKSMSDVPDWRIVTPKNSAYPFLEVYNEKDIEYSLGDKDGQYPVYKIHYFVDNSSTKSIKKMAIIPLSEFNYLKNPTTKYYGLLSYSAKKDDAADKILKRIQSKTDNGPEKNRLDQAVEEYQRAISYSQSKVRRLDDQKIYYRNDHLLAIGTEDPDIRISNSFPPNAGVESIEINISPDFSYKYPRDNSLALAILIEAKSEAEIIDDDATVEKINLAIINYQKQIEQQTTNNSLKIDTAINFEQNKSGMIGFSINKQTLPFSSPNYLSEAELKINNLSVCKIFFASASDPGVSLSNGCFWESSNNSGVIYLGENIISKLLKQEDDKGEFLVIQLVAHPKNDSFASPTKTLEAATIYK